MSEKESQPSNRSSKDSFNKSVTMSAFDQAQHNIAMKIHRLGNMADKKSYAKMRKRQETCLKDMQQGLEAGREKAFQEKLKAEQQKRADKLTADYTPKGFAKTDRNAKESNLRQTIKNEMDREETKALGKVRSDFLEEQQRCLKTVQRRHKMRQKFNVKAKSPEVRSKFNKKSENSMTNNFNDKGGRGK